MKDKFYVYVLRSKRDQKFYIGQTSDLVSRINAHFRGSVRSTKNRRPVELIYLKSFDNRSEAVREENRLKRYKDTEKFLEFTALRMAPSSSG